MPRRRLPPRHPDREGYTRIWRLVDGACKSALDAHPDWISTDKVDVLRNSIVKRIVGRLLASEAARSSGIASTVSPVDDQTSV